MPHTNSPRLPLTINCMYNLVMCMKCFLHVRVEQINYFAFALPITSWLDVADKCIEQGGKKRVVISDRESKRREGI